MPASGQSRRDVMRGLRQEDLREKISKANLLRDALDSVKLIEALDPTQDVYQNELSKIKAQNEVRFKLLNKILPELKASELNMTGNLKLVAIDMVGLEPNDDAEQA